MQLSFKAALWLILSLLCLLAVGPNANAQDELPEGTVGWWFYGPGDNNFAKTPVIACQNSAMNHMGTQLMEMRIDRDATTVPILDCKYPHFLNAGGEGWYAVTYLQCQPGYFPRFPGVCSKVEERPLCFCPKSDSSISDPGFALGNPVVLSTGAKAQFEIDPIGPLQGPLQITRTYRMFGEPGGSLGIGWAFSFDRKLSTPWDDGQAPPQVYGRGEQGSYLIFYNYGGNFLPKLGSMGMLQPVSPMFDEWVYKDNAGRVDHFKKMNGSYMLISSHTKEVQGQFFTYDSSNHLQTIADSFGRVLQVVWKNEYVIDSIAGPDLSVHYEYDLATIPSGVAILGTERLVKVHVKDASGSLLTTREYHYEDPRNRYILTGITDENGDRYATYAYDDHGMVVSSEHAGGADRHTFSYTSDISRTVTDPLGTQRNFNLTKLKDYGFVTSVAQPGGAGYGPASRSFNYDEQGSLTLALNLNGTKTCYAFDGWRNLETGRIEGVGAGTGCPSMSTTGLPSTQRKILTLWHPDSRVKVKIAEPKKITSFIYNGQADLNGQILTCAPATVLPDAKPNVVLCKRVEQATADTTGAAGFGAAPIGRPRTWTFTYNALGQILTSNGPAGENDKTTYAYYADTTSTHTTGDLWTVSNALGHVTEYLEYNKSGKATRLRDPNGSVTAFTYDPLLRLTSRTEGADSAAAQTTLFDYDRVGQLVKVTAPDASFVVYTYDAAHRLTDISDGLGNAVHYTLDNAGNRVREEIKDVNGSLSRQVIRSYDPLNRLQEVTGGAQ